MRKHIHAEPASRSGLHEERDAGEERSHASSRDKAGRAAIAVNVAHLSDFDEVIDVRSESEYAEDHIPGALNCPVLDNDERTRVGTMYKQSSSFDAKKLGASLVAANIARHLRERFHDRPRDWKPLVYCWRGGGRSEALAHVLARVGWRVGRLDGGYKAYRRAVMADLDALPRRFKWRVVCGMTGTGKSRTLRALAQAGAPVLDLEALAAHRGSVLGNMPDEAQPSQKMFDSIVWHALRGLHPKRPIFVESESKKIGRLRVPQSVIECMWSSECIVLEAPLHVRVALLKSDYAHYFSAPELLASQLDCLAPLHGSERIRRWQDLARSGSWDALVEDLLVEHYDPAYTRAISKHYPALSRAPRYMLREASESEFRRIAAAIIDDIEARRA